LPFPLQPLPSPWVSRGIADASLRPSLQFLVDLTPPLLCAADRVKLAAQLKELQAELKKLNEEGSLPGANKLSLSEMCARPLSCSLARLSIFGN
jgi:hypothetical protein